VFLGLWCRVHSMVLSIIYRLVSLVKLTTLLQPWLSEWWSWKWKPNQSRIAELMDATFADRRHFRLDQIQYGGRRPFWRTSNGHNSATHHPIYFVFGSMSLWEISYVQGTCGVTYRSGFSVPRSLTLMTLCGACWTCFPGNTNKHLWSRQQGRHCWSTTALS